MGIGQVCEPNLMRIWNSSIRSGVSEEVEKMVGLRMWCRYVMDLSTGEDIQT
jgi:thiamine biosynthesis protein ThiC